MSDEALDDGGLSEADETLETNAAAVAVALDGAKDNPRLTGPIREFLAEQRALVVEQRHHLREQLTRLKLNILSQRLSVGLKLMTVLVGLAVAGGLAIMVWNAADASGLVVEAFSAPPDFAVRGIGGDVVAQDLTAQLATVRRVAMEHSYSTSNDVSKDGGEIKVEIPETGISITEAWRLLRGWLGHERHVTGSLRETGDGKIALTANLDGGDVVTVTGAPADLAKLEQQEAEEIFGRFDPVNITNYLTARGRIAEAYAAAGRYVPIARTMLERADSYSLWSYTTAFATGDIRLGVARARIAIGIDPDIAVAHVQLARFEDQLGHDEAVLAQARLVPTLKDGDQPPAHRGHGFAEMRSQAAGWIARLLGDFANAVDSDCSRGCPLPEMMITRTRFAIRLHDIAAGSALMDQALAAGLRDDVALAEARYDRNAESGVWASALADARDAVKAYIVANASLSPRYVAETRAVLYGPLVALAEAHLAEFAQAHADIDATPIDCYDCVRARGNIDALQKNWGGAAYWLNIAVKQAPSIPFAYFDWGKMLLAKGDFDGTIAKFKVANQKGPHFADPLEMWGEALILKNRSDLALAKFAEAARYAPNWGRLHLKWGEALWWSGDKDGAQKQFSAAARLDLSVTERTNIKHWLRAS